MIFIKNTIYFIILSLFTIKVAIAKPNFVEVTSTAILIASPVYAFFTTYDDVEGIKQMAWHYGVTTGTMVALKLLISKERPDYQPGDKKNSFPSGHSSTAFMGASYIHRRHGFVKSIPWYIGAAYVGWSRIELNRHDALDVLTGAALAVASAYIFVDKKDTITPVIAYQEDRNAYFIGIHKTF